MDDEKIERMIVCEIPPCYFDVDPSTGALSQQTSGPLSYGGGWQNVPSFPTAIYYEGSIDLSGYAKADLTFSPYASFLQEGGFTFYRDGAGAYVLDIVSSVPLDATEVASSMVLSSTPGFIQVTALASTPLPGDNPDTIMHSHLRFMANDSSFPGNFFLTSEMEAIGSSLEATAADKLYFMRIAITFENVSASVVPPIVPAWGSQLSLPGARIKIPGVWSKEPELVYMMRLKRSYELANQR